MKKMKLKPKSICIIDLFVIIIITIVLIFLHYYKNNFNKVTLNIIENKIDEITTLYIKKNILPLNYDLNNLIHINLNDKNEILYMDVDYNYSYELLNDIVSKIQEDVVDLNNGNILNNKELKIYNGHLYIEIPLFISDNVLFSNIGPKIPIKISFFEYVIGSINSEVSSYGINNSILKVIMNLEVTQKINIPFNKKTIKKNYDVILSTKLINGKVPDVYGGIIKSSSSLYNID